MLLHRLVEYGRTDERVTPPYYQDKVVRWILELNPDGGLAASRLTSLADPADPRTRNGVVYTVPSIVKTSGITPTLVVDTPEYMFGWCEESVENPERVQRMHQRFRDLTDQWVAADASGAGRPLQRFLTEGHAQRLSQPSDWSRGDLVAVRVEGDFLHDGASARAFWAEVAGARKASGTKGICLVCGQYRDLLKTIPQQLPARLVPKATQRASLVSINKPTHGFALTEQLTYSPICVTCGLLAMSALERLLDRRGNSTVVDQDTRLAWWIIGDSTFDLRILEDPPTPQEIAEALAAAAKGRPLDDEVTDGDEETFCSLAIGGNVSRVMVRRWIEMPLRRTLRNIGTWFEDHAIVDRWTGQVRHVGLGHMVRVSGRYISGGATGHGSYAKPGATGADRPDGLYGRLIAGALLAKPLPSALLAHLVNRIRIDGRIDAERAAVLRLALRRNLPPQRRELYMPTLNPDNNQPAYLAGRVFAVLEDIQLSAARATGDPAPNTTFADKYWGRATTSPAIALLAGARDARAWLKRMRRHEPAWAEASTQRLEEISDRLRAAGGPPHGCSLAEKTAFILGYYQQCAEQRAAKKKGWANKQHAD